MRTLILLAAIATPLAAAELPVTRAESSNYAATSSHADVMSFIDGRRTVAAHGPREMPVWGAVFQEQNRGEHYPAYTSLLHSRALTEYLRSIQK